MAVCTLALWWCRAALKTKTHAVNPYSISHVPSLPMVSSGVWGWLT